MGIATDHCVVATALDASPAGFAVTVRLDLTAGVAAATTAAAVERMRPPASPWSASRWCAPTARPLGARPRRR